MELYYSYLPFPGKGSLSAVGKNLLTVTTEFYSSDHQIDCLNVSKLAHYLWRHGHYLKGSKRMLAEPVKSVRKLNLLNIFSYDNKSVSHWIMFDYFFHV